MPVESPVESPVDALLLEQASVAAAVQGQVAVELLQVVEQRQPAVQGAGQAGQWGAVPDQVPNGTQGCLSMDSDLAFQTIVSGSVLAKFGSFRTLGLYTLSRPKNPLVQITHSLDPENKAPLGSAEMSLGTDPKGAEYLRRPLKIGGGTTITNRCP